MSVGLGYAISLLLAASFVLMMKCFPEAMDMRRVRLKTQVTKELFIFLETEVDSGVMDNLYHNLTLQGRWKDNSNLAFNT